MSEIERLAKALNEARAVFFMVAQDPAMGMNEYERARVKYVAALNAHKADSAPDVWRELAEAVAGVPA